jgi:hypothetical protein
MPLSSPNQFMAPLRYASNRELAFRRARAQLSADYELVASEEPSYLRAAVPEGDLELLFLDEDAAVTLCAPSATTLRARCASFTDGVGRVLCL